MLVCVVHPYSVKLASKCILFWSTRVVCYLNATRAAYGVVVEVDIGAFVEAVVRGLLVGRGDVVVDVGEEGQQRHLALQRRHLV